MSFWDGEEEPRAMTTRETTQSRHEVRDAKWEEHRGHLMAFFRRKGFLEEDASELTQETLLRVWKGRNRLRKGNRFKAYLFEAAKNVYRNEIRRIKAAKRQATVVPIDDLSSIDGARLGEEDDVFEKLLHEEDLEMVRRELVGMPPRRRQCLALRLEGRRIREISRILGIDTGSVKRHLNLARVTLAEKLGGRRDREDARDGT